MAHDLRYGVAKSQADVAAADRKMVSKLNEISRNKSDTAFNINAGKIPIMAKIAGEKSGIIKPGSLASFGDADTPAIRAALGKLEQEGFGKGGAMAPGDKLKMAILQDMARKKSASAKGSGKRKKRKGGEMSSFSYKGQARGDGILSGLKAIVSNPHVRSLAKMAFNKLMPVLMKKLEGKGLKLAGQGLGLPGGALNKKLIKLVERRVLAAQPKLGKKGSGLGLPGNGKKLAEHVASESAKVMMPLLEKMARANIPEKQSKQLGSGLQDALFKGLKFLWKQFTESADREKYDPKSMAQLNRGIRSQADLDREYEARRRKRQGNGMSGEGFWKDFGDGFVKGFTGTMKFAAPLLKMLV